MSNSKVIGITGITALNRLTATATTTSLAAGASTTATSIILSRIYRLLSITTDRPARIRLYGTVAAQTADLNRVIGSDPAPGADVMFDYVTATGALTAVMSPLVDGSNMETIPTNIIAMTVQNLDSITSTVTVTFTYIDASTGAGGAGSITYSQIQNETANTLLGNPTGTATSPSEISLDSTLAFASATLGVANSGITATKLAASSVSPAKLNTTNSPSDTWIPTYDAATGKFTWISQSSLPTGSGMTQRETVVLTSSGSVSIPSWAVSVRIVALVGGGGGGGGITSSATNSGAGGGGAHSILNLLLPILTATTLSVVIGTGGSGGANTGVFGSDGTSSTLTLNGNVYTAFPGLGGSGSAGNSNGGKGGGYGLAVGGIGASSSGTPGGDGTITQFGAGGGGGGFGGSSAANNAGGAAGFYSKSTAAVSGAGGGGSSAYGLGGAATTGIGGNGSGYGSGGAGSAGSSASAGGNGAAGICIIEFLA